MMIVVNNCDDSIEKPWLMSEKDGCIYDDKDYSENDAWC